MCRDERSTSTIWVSLTDIRGGRRGRSISDATVEQYRRWLEQGRMAPPVRLARSGEGFLVRDGRHRIAAALAAGHTVIEAEIRPIAAIRSWLIVAIAGPHRVARAATVVARATLREGLGTTLWRGLLACTEEERVRFLPSPCASVVSTASTRPLYG
jgi:hypothetical protein